MFLIYVNHEYTMSKMRFLMEFNYLFHNQIEIGNFKTSRM